MDLVDSDQDTGHAGSPENHLRGPGCVLLIAELQSSHFEFVRAFKNCCEYLQNK